MDYEKMRDFNAERAPWEVAPDRDARALGNKIISTPEKSFENLQGNGEQLGQILPVEPAENVSETPNLEPENGAKFNPNLIKEEKGKKRIGKVALNSTTKVINDFNHDGDTAKLYESVRGKGGITETYILGSFDRKLGESA
ncbi:MAG: hypothetical protein Q4B34_01070 [Candidatus Saccharibacteria bacterium]|nr:hypothetical protein [Candidatus Saccharibacteria bacterium]